MPHDRLVSLPYVNPATHPQQHTSIYITTLGTLAVYLGDGTPAIWHRVGAGTNQLQRALAFLIVNRDRFVAIEDVLLVAGSGAEGVRPDYLITALGTLFKRWEMRIAFERRRRFVCLRTHPTWRTDTDDLTLLLDHVSQLAPTEQQSYTLLTNAVSLCNGIYLQDYDPPSEFQIDDERAYWITIQQHALRSMAQICLLASEYHAAERHVQKVLNLDPSSSSDWDLMAEIARQTRPHLVDFYLRKAQQHRRVERKPPPTDHSPLS